MRHIRNSGNDFSERTIAEFIDEQRKNQGERHTPAQIGDVEPNGVTEQPPKEFIIEEPFKVFKPNPWTLKKTELGFKIFKRH